MKTITIDQMLENIDAVLFDCDGTLVDSMWIWGEVDRIYLERYNIPMPEDLTQRLSGISVSQAADYFREELGIPQPPEKMIADWNELARDQYANHVPPKAGAVKFLDYLKSKGIKMGVGTSNTSFLAYTVLESRDLKKYFDTILTGEDVKIGKPDPYIYLEAARRLGVDPSRCMVFEDIPNGLRAGVAAGMKTCAVFDLFSQIHTDEIKALADYYIQDFEAIFNGLSEDLK